MRRTALPVTAHAAAATGRMLIGFRPRSTPTMGRASDIVSLGHCVHCT